ncbi:MAG: enoyl-CoA hydratase/isomerase family protein [Holophagales bacterium]|nr:enoyl-CoA hydratase/isomerase family protein [Holophagales bacterium]
MVAEIEIHRPPNNFFDLDLIGERATAIGELDERGACRAAVLCSEGKHFCAGANLNARRDATGDGGERHLYDEAVRLFDTRTPIVAAVQGAAIGGGLGLALMPDFRVACPEARFSANFARLGFVQGFGLTVTLPRLVGRQRAMEMFYTGRRVKGEEALRIGLCDDLVPLDQVRTRARELAREIAVSAPLAVRSIREMMRGRLAAEIRSATDHEKAEQNRLRQTADFAEGVRAMTERRPPRFVGA